MKRIGLLALVLSVAWVGWVGAESEEQTPGDVERLATSAAKWKEFQKRHQDSYSYKKSRSSMTGAGWETTIVVREGKVVERRFRQWAGRMPIAPVAPGQEPPQPKERTWVETGEQIGSHKEGAPPQTLDQLYAEAQTVLARDLKPFEKRHLRFDNAGLLNSCFIVDTRIMDDAPIQGVSIRDIAPIKAPE